MNRSPLFVTTLAIVLSVVGGMTALQADPNKKWEQPHWKVPKAQYDEIVDVSLTAKLVTIHHVGGTMKVDHTLKVGAFADIRVNDKKATLAELKPGMRVIFSMTGDGLGLDRLETVQPPPPPPTPVPTAPPSFPHGVQ